MYLYLDNFSGSLPSSLGNQKFLKRLDLHSNWFSGVIAASIPNMTNSVMLNLQENFLTGYIPVRVGDLGVYEELDLSKYLQWEDSSLSS